MKQPEPNPGLVARWMDKELELEQTVPTGDPEAVLCSIPTKGSPCGRGRIAVGPSRVLMCLVCDGPGTGYAPNWTRGR